MNGRQASARLRELADRLKVEIDGLTQLRAESDGLREENQRQLEAVCLELAAVYLPELSAAALQDAEKRTGFRGFSRRDPFKAMERERGKLRGTIERVSADPTYVRREYLAGSNGSITLAVKEAKENLEVWEREVQRFESLEGFTELVSVGYDTPEHTERWWNADYWRHWAAGDRICNALGMADFGDDVLPAWRKAREPRDQWKGELERHNAELRKVLDLVKSKDDAEYRLEHLDEIYLEDCRKMLAGHLASADVGLLDQWRGEDRGAQILLRRLSGISARRSYFGQLAGGGLSKLIADLNDRRKRMLRKAEKLARPKNAGRPVGDPAPGLESKLDGIAARRQKAARQNQQIQGFSDWDRYEVPDRSELWFSLWSSGAPPVWLSDWREAVGQGRPRREDSAAQAIVEQGFSHHGDLS